MRLFLPVVLLLAACANSASENKSPAAPAAGAPAAAPAPTPAAPATVGKDGPDSVKVVALTTISGDAGDVAAGEKIFAEKGCAACHKFGEKLVGPDLKGVFGRRTITWVERQISDPSFMIHNDPQSKQLFATYMVEMTRQGVSDEEMPKLLAYIKAQGG